MNKKTTLFAPDYTTPVCKTLQVRVQQRILDGSPIDGDIDSAAEYDYGEY